MKNNVNPMETARVLSEALPYIQKYHGKTVVVKYGGGAKASGDSDDANDLCRSVISDIVLLSLVGISVVVVQGGGPDINAMLAKIGKEPRFINGLRYTDEETMDIVQMVLCGRVGKQLVQLIAEQGGRAISLSGLDGGLFKASRITEGEDLGFVGDHLVVNPEAVRMVQNAGYIPVVSTVASGGNKSESLNINADSAAAGLASALQAEKLILLTDVRGLMKDKTDESTLISEVHIPEVPALIKSGIIAGGMIPKVNCCTEAVRQGVSRAHILDGRMPHSILTELFSDTGIGTMFLP